MKKHRITFALLGFLSLGIVGSFILGSKSDRVPAPGSNDPRVLRENCRLLGIISRSPSLTGYFSNILFQFKDPRYSQLNGWSISIFSDFTQGGKLSIPGKPMIIRSDRNVEDDDELYTAVSDLAVRLEPNCIIGHLRNASSGCDQIADPHPFQKEFQGKQYLFIHNGGVWGADLETVLSDLLDDSYQPENCPGMPIDSEALFVYLLQIMKEKNCDPFTACKYWTKQLLTHLTDDWNALNIILTDGESLWAVRASYRDEVFLLHYNQTTNGDAYAISTEALDYGWNLMINFSVIELKTGHPPRIEIMELPPEMTPIPTPLLNELLESAPPASSATSP